MNTWRSGHTHVSVTIIISHSLTTRVQEVTITPGEDEEVVELTLEARHMLPVLSAIVGLAAAIYALIFYTNV